MHTLVDDMNTKYASSSSANRGFALLEYNAGRNGLEDDIWVIVDAQVSSKVSSLPACLYYH